MLWLEKEELDNTTQQALLTLWNQEYPFNVHHPSLASLQGYLNQLNSPEHTLVEFEGRLVAWLATFNREGCRWFAMIVDGNFQGKGLVRQLLKKAQAKNKSLLGWAVDHDRYTKADGSPYPSPIGFYLKNSFELLPDQRFENEQLSAAMIQWNAP